MAGSEEAQMDDGYVGDVAVGRAVLRLSIVQVRDREKRSGRPKSVPGEDVTVRVAACDGRVVGGDGNRCYGTGFHG